MESSSTPIALGITQWNPTCSEDEKPKLNMVFDTLEDAMNFYTCYAKIAGFDIRHHTAKKDIYGRITRKYMCCSREGKSKGFMDSFEMSPKMKVYRKAIGKRRMVTSRVGCKANIVFSLTLEGKYKVASWREAHNHRLSTPSSEPFLMINRDMTVLQKKFVVDCSKSNIGPVRSYRLFKDIVGGYGNIGATGQDFKNFQRDLKAYIGGSDAQMVLDNFFEKKQMWSAFYFDYDIDDDGNLTRLFWADPISRKNYAYFGDVISFDTTYRSNKYKMVFGPFTGVDNHKKCVTFGAGFLAKEDTESFEWIFKRFLEAMGHEPSLMITDQDPAMKAAFGKVFATSKHRYCMWHIMTKLPEKVGIARCTEGFLKSINSCVWDAEIEPAEFERKWNEVIDTHKLGDNVWLKHLYNIRDTWIPAYYRDLYMGGLLRTTSRSESENSFFNRFTNTWLTLVEYMMRFESAMDVQRHNQAQLNHMSYHTMPKMKTPFKIERQAAEVYTHTVFYEIQDNIYEAFYSVKLIGLQKDGDMHVYELGLKKPHTEDRVHRVWFNAKDKEAKCSCKMFERVGIPCRHIYFAFLNDDDEVLPRSSVLNRWTKDATRVPLHNIDASIFENSEKIQRSKTLLNDLWSEINMRVSEAERNNDIEGFLEHVRSYKAKTASDAEKKQDTSNTVIEALIGARVPEQVIVKVPKYSKTKGSGAGGRKRILGGKEVATKKAQKKKKAQAKNDDNEEKKGRMCRLCKEFGYHDARNCPKKNISNETVVDCIVETDQEVGEENNQSKQAQTYTELDHEVMIDGEEDS